MGLLQAVVVAADAAVDGADGNRQGHQSQQGATARLHQHTLCQKFGAGIDYRSAKAGQRKGQKQTGT